MQLYIYIYIYYYKNSNIKKMYFNISNNSFILWNNYNNIYTLMI